MIDGCTLKQSLGTYYRKPFANKFNISLIRQVSIWSKSYFMGCREEKEKWTDIMGLNTYFITREIAIPSSLYNITRIAIECVRLSVSMITQYYFSFPELIQEFWEVNVIGFPWWVWFDVNLVFFCWELNDVKITFLIYCE